MSLIVLIENGKMFTGSIFTVCFLFQKLIKPIDEVYRFMDETASSVIKSKALIEVTASPSDDVFNIEASDENTSSSEICIEDVVITNPEKDTPLASYDRITISTNKFVSFTGPNGCGKNQFDQLHEQILSTHKGRFLCSVVIRKATPRKSLRTCSITLLRFPSLL